MWGRTITITRLGGFDIKIDASWFLIAGLIIWSLATGYFPEILPASDQLGLFAAATLAMLGLFVSLILHELAHSVMARRRGIRISGITLFLFGGVAELETEPEDPETEIQVAIVGPLASLALAGFFWSCALIADLLNLGTVVVAIADYLAVINLTLALFNLAPAFPLDGGRVLRAVLWRSGGDLVTATRRAATVSSVFAWGLIALGAATMLGIGARGGIWPILLGFFLLILARNSYEAVEIKSLFTGKSAADLMTRDPVTAHPEQSLAEVVNRVFLSNGLSFAPVIEDHTLLGYVDIHMIRRIDREHWAATTVDDVVESCSEDNTIAPDLPAQALLDRMTTTGQRKFLVVEGGMPGGLVGVVTLSDVARHLNISRQIASLNRSP